MNTSKDTAIEYYTHYYNSLPFGNILTKNVTKSRQSSQMTKKGNGVATCYPNITKKKKLLKLIK